MDDIALILVKNEDVKLDAFDSFSNVKHYSNARLIVKLEKGEWKKDDFPELPVVSSKED